jgi:uncharacterized protein (TIRG00374 family)
VDKSNTVARIFFLLIGLGLLAFVASQTDLAEVWGGVVELGIWGALAVLGIYFVDFLIGVISWYIMLPSIRPGLRWVYRLWKVRMAGEALNLVLPAASVGGEPVKVVLLGSLHGIDYHEGTASLIMAKTVTLLALLAFAAVGFAIMLRVEEMPEFFVPVAGIGLVALSLGVVGVFAAQRWRVTSRLAKWLAPTRISRPLERILAHIREVDEYFKRFYFGQRVRFACTYVLGMSGWILGAAEVYVIMWFLGRPVSFADAWLIETVAQLARVGAFFIPAGLGATEAALVLIYDALFGLPALGFAVAIIRRGRELVWTAWGLWLGWLQTPDVAAIVAAARNSAAVGRDRSPS